MQEGASSTVGGQGTGLARFPALGRSAWRRAAFFTAAMAQTALATWVMADILWRGGLTGIEIALLALFAPLFGVVALGFTQAVAGFLVLLRRRDPTEITITLPDAAAAAGDLPATAVAFPIHNEDVSRVYEGIRTLYLSLARAGALPRFDIFILSDSSDPNAWIEEEVAWLDLCKQLKGFGRIFYRKRFVPLNRKSGNVSDFLRRWGRRYRYMILLDADSLMEGSTLVRLVRLMEANPQAGIVQTVPVSVQGRSLFARVQQFAGSLYGPVFAAGLNGWQGGCGNFWGHNAIIRVAPFMEHCALPPLQGSFRFSRTRFMSHDYVEAALMRRAGYEVWLAYTLGGSYENPPPTLIDAARRDRRWCRGNLQHAWLLAAEGLHPVHRLHLFLGIMSYVAAPLWLAFLALGTAQCWRDWSRHAPPRFDADIGLSPYLDIGGGRLTLLLFLVTLGMLTAPKLLAVLLALVRGARRRAFGGGPRIVAGFLVEHLLSAFLAPIQMLFNTSFVAQILVGRKVAWGGQRREAGRVDWGGCVRAHAAHTLLGAAWAATAWLLHPAYFWWMSPVTFGLIASIPLSALLGDEGLGRLARRAGLLLTPHETVPPPVVAHVEKNLEAVGRRLAAPDWLRPHNGVLQAVLDPYINAVHLSLLRRKRQLSHPASEYLRRLRDRLLEQGPGALSRRELVALLRSREVMRELHERLWTQPEAKLSSWWRLAMRHYNTLTVRPQTALYR